MTYLPQLSLRTKLGENYNLPTDTVEASLNTDRAKRIEFRVLSGVQELMSQYARAVVAFLDELIGTDEQLIERANGPKVKPRRLDYKSTDEVLWKVKNSDDERIYSIDAKTLNEEYESFDVITDKEDVAKVKSVEWTRMGFLPGAIRLEADQDGVLKLQNLSPRLSYLPELYQIRDERSFEGTYRKRLKNTLVNEARWLKEIDKLNVNSGIKVGDYRFYSKKEKYEADRIQCKRLQLVRYGDRDAQQDSTQLSVLLNNEGDIVEIERYSVHSDSAIKLEKTNCVDIADSAKLTIYDVAKSRKVNGPILDELAQIEQRIQELSDSDLGVFALEPFDKLKTRQEALMRDLITRMDSRVYSIHSDSFEKKEKEARDALLKTNNRQALLDHLRLILFAKGKEFDEKKQDLFTYAGIDDEAISPAFFKGYSPSSGALRGGFAKTMVENVDGQETELSTFGDVDLRRAFLRDDGRFKYHIAHSNVLEYLEKIGFKLTDAEQDKAIMRWQLMNNPESLKKLGVVIERAKSRDKKDKAFFFGKIGDKRLKEARLKLESFGGVDAEVKLTDFPNHEVIGAARDKIYTGPKRTRIKNGKEVERKGENWISTDVILKQVLKDLGFEIASTKEREDYIRDHKEQMRPILEQEFNHSKDSYKFDLSLALAEQHLIAEGYEKVERVIVPGSRSGNYKVVLKAQKDSEPYVYKVMSTHKRKQHSEEIASIATGLGVQHSGIIRVKDLELYDRTAGSIAIVA